MEEAPEPEAFEEVDAVPVLAEEAGPLAPRPSAAAGVVVAKQAAAVAATSFAAGVVTVAAVRAGRAVRARRRARRRASQLPPVLATRSFLIDVHLLGSRD
jgi:NADPH-dependent FMN reductase